MRRTLSTARLVMTLLLAMALASGCSGDDADPPAAQKQDQAKVLLERAKAAVDGAQTLHFTVTTSEAPAGGASLVGADGNAARPDRFQGDFKVSLGGATATVGVISIGGKVYAKLPFTTGYRETDTAQFGVADPGRLLDPETGVSSLLVKAKDAKLAGKNRVDGEVVQDVTGTIPGEAIKELLLSADPASPVAATFGVVEESGQLRRVVVKGPFFKAGLSSTLTIVLDRYGEPVDISAPPGT
jgi:lipoprotein LprG